MNDFAIVEAEARVVRASVAFIDEETPDTRSELLRAVLDLKNTTRRTREEWLVTNGRSNR